MVRGWDGCRGVGGGGWVFKGRLGFEGENMNGKMIGEWDFFVIWGMNFE